jgi:hypothetical protein
LSSLLIKSKICSSLEETTIAKSFFLKFLSSLGQKSPKLTVSFVSTLSGYASPATIFIFSPSS